MGDLFGARVFRDGSRLAFEREKSTIDDAERRLAKRQLLSASDD
jgi:hypothetical protein